MRVYIYICLPLYSILYGFAVRFVALGFLSGPVVKICQDSVSFVANKAALEQVVKI
jgi:hypothetical protein